MNFFEVVFQKFNVEGVFVFDIEKKIYINDEFIFCFDFNEDQMVVEKFCEGISKFVVDVVMLKDIIKVKVQVQMVEERKGVMIKK